MDNQSPHNKSPDFNAWFRDWYKERRQYPCRLAIELSEPIQENTQLSVTIHPLRDHQDPTSGHTPPRFKSGYEAPVCFYRETLNQDTALQLETALVTIRKAQGLDFKEGLAYMTFWALICYDYSAASRYARSFLLGPAYDESISPTIRNSLQSRMQQFVFGRFDTLLDFWNVIGVRFAKGIFPIPLDVGRISYMTIPPHWLSINELQRRGEAQITPPKIPLIVDARIYPQIKKIVVSMEDAVNSLCSSRKTPEIIAETLQVKHYTFHLSGDYWLIRYHGPTIRVKNSRGLQLIAFLLNNPGAEYPVLKLVHLISSPPEGTSKEPFEEYHHITQVDALRDAGPVADKKAIGNYQNEIQDLDREIAEAKRNNDVSRIELLENERQTVLGAIQSARGLGKSVRKVLSSSERARATVTMAIKTAIKKIGQQDPDLSTYLQQTIKTGGICKYYPSKTQRVDWVF